MLTFVPKDEHDFCIHIIRKRIPLPKSWGGDFCCPVIRKSPYIIITGGTPCRHHPYTDRRPFCAVPTVRCGRIRNISQTKNISS